MGIRRISVTIAALLCISVAACKKDNVILTTPGNPDKTTQDTVVNKDTCLPCAGVQPMDSIDGDFSDYTEYFIPKGQQNCTQSRLEAYTPNTLRFFVEFDSSAVYTSTNPSNQADINKLFGFSDCNSDQHTSSARFGWRYYKGQLQLLAYTYAGGVRDYKLITPIDINKIYCCKLLIDGESYKFYVDDADETIMQRSCTGNAVKFRLFPYFGGDELAPHDIRIKIKELN